MLATEMQKLIVDGTDAAVVLEQTKSTFYFSLTKRQSKSTPRTSN